MFSYVSCSKWRTGVAAENVGLSNDQSITIVLLNLMFGVGVLGEQACSRVDDLARSMQQKACTRRLLWFGGLDVFASYKDTIWSCFVLGLGVDG